jgi:predicted DCC family thiol-disulfide oxidoreductase YuxK
VKSVVLFDGECNLCSGAVQFVLRRDRRARFRFASLQSAAGRAALAAAGAPAPLPDSMVLIEEGQIHLKSTAALRIARGLRFPWPALAVLLLVPRRVRDVVYDQVARRRYRWFGRRQECLVPTAALRARFLDAAERPAAGS